MICLLTVFTDDGAGAAVGALEGRLPCAGSWTGWRNGPTGTS